jgi:hypothetical protein
MCVLPYCLLERQEETVFSQAELIVSAQPLYWVTVCMKKDSTHEGKLTHKLFEELFVGGLIHPTV